MVEVNFDKNRKKTNRNTVFMTVRNPKHIH